MPCLLSLTALLSLSSVQLTPLRPVTRMPRPAQQPTRPTHPIRTSVQRYVECRVILRSGAAPAHGRQKSGVPRVFQQPRAFRVGWRGRGRVPAESRAKWAGGERHVIEAAVLREPRVVRTEAVFATSSTPPSPFRPGFDRDPPTTPPTRPEGSRLLKNAGNARFLSPVGRCCT